MKLYIYIAILLSCLLLIDIFKAPSNKPEINTDKNATFIDCYIQVKHFEVYCNYDDDCVKLWCAEIANVTMDEAIILAEHS